MSKSVALLLVLVFLAASFLGAILPVKASADSWVLKAPMPEPEAYVGAAVVNGKIYTFGGTVVDEEIYPFYSTDCATQVYDPATDTWATKASMPNPTIGFAVTSYQNKIYVMGGAIGFDWSIGVNRVYDPATDTWQIKAPIPKNVSYICANVVDGKIYVMGGLLNDVDPLLHSPVASNATLIYDPATDKWSEGPSMPTGVYGYASAIVDNKIYVIGGTPTDSNPNFPPRSPLHFNQIYNTETDTWTFGADPPFGGGTAGATTGMMAAKRIYLFGGGGSFIVGGINPQQINQMYDSPTNTWVNCAEMINGRFGLAAVVLNDKLYAIGGTTDWVQGQGYVPSATNALYTPIGYGITTDRTAPEIVVLSPENKTYDAGYVSLIFVINKPVVWLGYSLDGKMNSEIFGNTTLIYNTTLFDKTTLSYNTTVIYGLYNEIFGNNTLIYGVYNGLHNITVVAIDPDGNIGASKTIIFSIGEETKPESEPFPTIWVAAAAAVSVAVISVGLLFYFKKRKRNP